MHRHFPRLCRTCEAPMARQEETCWRCGAVWVDRLAPPAPVLGVIADPAVDRWTGEGGGLAAERPPRVATVAGARE